MNISLKKETVLALIGIMTFAIGVSFIFLGGQSVALGSVSQTDEYIATSTAGNSLQGAFTTSRVVKTGVGTFGSVVITGANTGIIAFYDATTTDATKRASSMATSTIFLGAIPASAAAGTYTFDVRFSNGLFVDRNPQDLGGGAFPTTTITYR